MNKLYQYKFELFLGSQLAILFGSILTSWEIFENHLANIVLYTNILIGSLIINRDKKTYPWGILTLLPFFMTFPIFFDLSNSFENVFVSSKLVFLFAFNVWITACIIKDIWSLQRVNSQVFLALASGFISLGFIGFILCFYIELNHPTSFSGIYRWSSELGVITERLMYYSYTTLLTIGSGDILPITQMAQKATIFIGLSGQLYLVILTTLILEKYIRQNKI